MYNPASRQAEEFINHKEILDSIQYARENQKNRELIEGLLNAEENREIMDTYIFSAGIKVWCPEVAEQTAVSDLPAWRDSV